MALAYLQGCRKLLKVGGGANGAAKLGGGGKLGLKVGSYKQN